MAFHQLGAPELPIFQEHAERFLSMRIAVAAKKFAGGWRSTSTRIEKRNVDFALGKRAVDEWQVADDASEKAEAEASFGNDKCASHARTWNHIAEPECEKRCPAEVGVGPEAGIGSGDVDGGTGTVLHQREAENQSDGPNGHQNQQREWTEDSERGFADFFRWNQSRNEFPGAPGVLVKETRKTEPPGHAPRENDHLESVPYDDENNGDAGEECG